MKHIVINKIKSSTIQDSCDEITVSNSEKGKLILRKNGENKDINIQLRGRDKMKGDEFDGKQIRW